MMSFAHRERMAAGKELVEDYAERPDVGALVYGFTLRLLRRHICRRSQERARLRQVHRNRRRHRATKSRTGVVGGIRLFCCGFGQAKIQELNLPVGCDPDVGWFEVAVDDALFVRGRQTGGDRA
jgi:hypothetical protein